MRVVTWGRGDMALVDDGQVVSGSSTDAQDQLRQLLAKPARGWLPGDRAKLYHPGDPGHLEAATAGLPGVTISPED